MPSREKGISESVLVLPMLQHLSPHGGGIARTCGLHPMNNAAAVVGRDQSLSHMTVTAAEVAMVSSTIVKLNV